MLTNNGLTKERTKTRKIGQLNKKQIATPTRTALTLTMTLTLTLTLTMKRGEGDDDRRRRWDDDHDDDDLDLDLDLNLNVDLDVDKKDSATYEELLSRLQSIERQLNGLIGSIRKP